MTRDEAKARINYTGDYSKENVDELIDWIYDDFENRICKNCMYFDKKNEICINKKLIDDYGWVGAVTSLWKYKI